MKTVNEILTKAGEKFVGGLRSQFETGGHNGGTLNDTHGAEKSLSFKVSGNKLEIEGLLRTVVLITGRKAGPISIEGKKSIRAWVIRKLGVDEEDADGVTFVIARKIEKEGTEIFTRKAKGLQIEMLIAEINKELEEEVSTQIGLNVTETVFEAFK